MQNVDAPAITQLLNRWRGGDRDAERELITVLYPALKHLAKSRLARSGSGLTLRPTELVHEVYERLFQVTNIEWTDRTHFLAVAANAIRNIVVDHVRARQSEKRGGGIDMVPLHELGDDADLPSLDIDLDRDWIGMDRVLVDMEKTIPVSARLVELKFFAGMNTDEIAAAMSISRATVVREWRFARAYIAERLGAPSLHSWSD